MAELHLKGYVSYDSDGIVGLHEEKIEEVWKYCSRSLVDEIESWAKEHGLFGKHSQGLGGRKAYIDDCNMRIYFTDKKCNIEDAMLAIDTLMYGGDIKTKVSYEGYSEWTITGLCLDEFTIGGHDLSEEISSHYGQYAHVIIR